MKGGGKMAKVNKVRKKTTSRMLFEEARDFFKKNYTNNVTRRMYVSNYRKFIELCRTEYDQKSKEDCKKHIQEYADYLKDKGYQASTIHTYIAPVCSYHNVNMKEIKKDIRSTADYKRGRTNNGRKERSDNDFNNPKYKYSIEFQKRIGIRRAELEKLTGDDLVIDESGYLCVRVKSGKGGKKQLQRILPQDCEYIKTYFENKNRGERIFSKAELNNSQSYHTLRAQNARRCYEYYLDLIATEEGRTTLTGEIRLRFAMPDKNGKIKHKAFKEEFVVGTYKLKGNNKKLAVENNLPTEYDKLALMAVSVFHLSHWRNDVTVASYMLAI